MDKQSPRWIGFLLGRVVSYALLGGLTMAVSGAIMISLSGALVGWVIDSSGIASLDPGGWAVLGAWAGAFLGGIGGGIAGLVIWSIVGFLGVPRRSFLLPKVTLSKVLLGMSVVTLAAMTSFFLASALLSYIYQRPFQESVERYLMFIMFGAPAMMVCGAIAGAIIGFRRETVAGREKNIA